MSTGPHRFILEALDPDHGSPVLVTSFYVLDLGDLHVLRGVSSDDHPELDRCFSLDAAEFAAITERFGVAFDPEGREVCLCSRTLGHLTIPYLIHTGYELPLLLEGRKPFARMNDAYPPDRHHDEEKFDRYVAQGVLHKEVVVEPFKQAYRPGDGRVLDGMRTVYYTRKGEEWRIPASKLIWAAAAKSSWNEDFERMEGMLFGYEEWQNDWWLADRRKHRGAYGCLLIYRSVNAEEMAWIEAAGYRALPPVVDSAMAVSLIYDRPDDDTTLRLMDCSGAIALLRLSVRSLPFLDLVDGQSGPDYLLPAGRIKDLNRNIVGEIEIISRRTPEGALEASTS